MARNGSTKGSAGSNRSSGGAPAARKTDIRWSEAAWVVLGRRAEVAGTSRAGVVKAIVGDALSGEVMAAFGGAPAALGEGSSGLPERVAASVQEASAAPPAALDGPGAYERHVAGEDAAFEASMGGRPAVPGAFPGSSAGVVARDEALAAPAPSGRADLRVEPGVSRRLEDRVLPLVVAQFGRRLDNLARAARWVREGRVMVDGRVVRDPSVLVDNEAEVSV